MNELEFEKIFRDYFVYLSNIAFNVVKDEDTAKDLVQQVFLKLWQKKETLQIHGKVKSYLHRAVVNTCLNYLEKNKNIRFLQTMEDTIMAEENTKSSFDNEEIKLFVNEAVDALPDKCRMVFSLSRFSGMKNKEIAEYMDISIKSVEKHIGKALKKLKISLEPIYNNMFILMFGLFFLAEVGYLIIYLSNK